MAEEGKSEYREIVLKTLRERPWKDDKGFGCWIVQTVKDGKSFKVQVRAGMYRPDKVNGGKVLPKDGLEIGDLKTLKANWKEVEALLNFPKGTPVDPRTPDADKPDDEKIDEVPW